jgi:hypothetical protein
MSTEIIQNVAASSNNYDDFQHFNFIFSQNFIFGEGSQHGMKGPWWETHHGNKTLEHLIS